MTGCSNKYPTYFGDIVPDTYVRYTGMSCEALGICTGDMLNTVINTLVSNLCTGFSPEITVPTPDCSVVNSHDGTLSGAFSSVYDSICQLDSNITITNNYINEKTNLNLNGKCVTLPSSPTINNVFQAVIDYICSLSIGSSVSNTDILNIVFNAIDNCGENFIKRTGSGANQKLTLSGFVPKGTLLCGNYNLNDFDNNGLGINGLDSCGWALADGRNGTLDMRGFAPVGATNYGSGALNATVDPVLNSDSDYNISVGQVKGKVKEQLIANQLPPHTHGYYETTIPLPQSGNTDCTVGVTGVSSSCIVSVPTIVLNTGPNLTTNAPIDKRQPSKGVVWIQKI